MKKAVLLACLLLVLPFSPAAQAQQPAALDTLRVEIWPDYDRNAILVLLTGSVPTTPATVTIPVPQSAELNAVARITPENNMVDDFEVDTTVPGEITFTLTTDTRFRVEYYDDYETVDGRNSYTFTWTAPIAVEALETLVQQPTAASLLTVNPPAVAVETNVNDGLTYHFMTTQRVPALQPYSVTLSYDNPGGALTANNPPPAPVGGSEPTAVSGASSDFPWELTLGILGGVAIAGIIVWQLAGQQQARRRPARKPKPTARKKGKGREQSASTKARPQQPSSTPRTGKAAKFCHECGAPLAPQDKFCRECGTAVKQR